jgi:FkbM family methyltransferase
VNIPSLPTASALFERLPRTLRRHRLMKAWMSLTGEDPLQLVRIRDDSFGYADMNDGFLRLIVIDGDFEREFFALADAFLARGGVFMDVGANYGLLSCGLAGRHRSKVHFHLFEPNPKLAASIARSAARYPLMHYNLNRVAVSDHSNGVSFLMNERQSGASHITERGGIQVPSITIDDYLDRAHIKSVDLLKIDIEGYELSAIRGAEASLLARRIHAIYLEYFEKYLLRVASPGELLKLLDELNYEVCFCRENDLAARGGGSHTIRSDLPGYGIALRPIKGHVMPPMTDLLAVPKENIVLSQA